MTCCYGWGNIDWTKDEVEKLKGAECSEELKSLIAIFSISSTSRPRLVTAGVPILTPLVIKGLCGSLGIAFLFTVM